MDDLLKLIIESEKTTDEKINLIKSLYKIWTPETVRKENPLFPPFKITNNQ